MDKKVRIFRYHSWYKVYGNGAKIVSFLADFKLFEDILTKKPCVSFSERFLKYAVSALASHKISFEIINGNNVKKFYFKENNYYKYLHKDLPYSSEENLVIKPKGTFVVQYDGEEELTFNIGKNINPDAELVKMVALSSEGNIIDINGNKIKIIKKDIR